MRLYHRDPETVFPTGPHPVLGSYKNATSIPFNFSGESLYNPKMTTGCQAE